MKMSHPNHPVWAVATGTILVMALGLMLKFNYNQFDSRDITTMLVLGITSFVTSIAKNKMAKPSQDDSTDKDSQES